MFKKYALLLLFPYLVSAQVGINTTSPQASLHVQEETPNTANTGVLIPRVNDLNVAPSIGQDGMMVFLNVNWTEAGTGKMYERGFWFWNNSVNDWSKLESDKHDIGDIKQGFQIADHKGWYLLDGRLTNTLSVSASANASGIGFVTNLPDARDKVLKTTDGSETIASSAGTNSYSLSQANLPAISLNGVTNITGGHQHTYGGYSLNSGYSGYHNHYTNPRSLVTSSGGAHNHRQDTYTFYSNAGIDQGNLGGLSGDDIYTRTGYTAVDGSHGHSINLPSLTTNSSGNHLHQVTLPLASTTNTGGHNHTVSVGTGGTAAAIDNRPAHLVVNTFVYLGN